MFNKQILDILDLMKFRPEFCNDDKDYNNILDIVMTELSRVENISKSNEQLSKLLDRKIGKYFSIFRDTCYNIDPYWEV